MKGLVSAVLLALVVALGSNGARQAGAGADSPPTAATAAAAPNLRPDQIRLLRDALAASPAQGFDEGEFMPAGLDALLQSRDPASQAQGQALLLSEIVRYASALHRGRLPEAAFDKEWGMRPAPYDAQAAFDQALMQDRLKAWLDDLPPPYLGYQQLVAGLKTYRDLAPMAVGSRSPMGRS
jgi:murein L,D-transpeptidase YcbB/YkuD